MGTLLPENRLPFDSSFLGGLREYGRRIFIFIVVLFANIVFGFLLYGIVHVPIEAIVSSVFFIMLLLIILAAFAGAAMFLQPYVAKRGISVMIASQKMFGGPGFPVRPDATQALARMGFMGALQPEVFVYAIRMLLVIRRGEKIIGLLKHMEATTGLRYDDDLMREYHEILTTIYRHLLAMGVIREIGIGATNSLS